ncbi:helix-turn-helix transcriptional regulator [Planctomycetota bacterium]
MRQDNEFEAVCSVRQMADKLGLSRPRFYQLLKLGVFPPPVYCPYTKRPFYPLELQNGCLHIRETGIGRNGKPILFYSPRKKNNGKGAQKRGNEGVEHFKSLSTSLRELGIKVSIIEVQKAMKALFPEGLPKDRDNGSIIPDLFKYFRPERMNDV